MGGKVSVGFLGATMQPYEVNMINEKMKQILGRRSVLHIEDDMGIQKCWDEIIALLSIDELSTIKYLSECTEEELYFISEVFEDILKQLQSKDLIKCLRELDEKHPQLEMTRDIDLAEEYIEYTNGAGSHAEIDSVKGITR